jgi:glycopeptide antibiotics resistance protein
LFSFTDGGLVLIPGFWALLPAIPIGLLIWRRGTDRRRTLMLLLALIHIDLVIALTLFPIPIGGQEFYRHTRGMSEDNIVPFTTIIVQLVSSIPFQHRSLIASLHALMEMVGNMAALAPLAIYGPALWPSLRRWRRFAVVAIAFSVGIELSQLAGSLIEGFTYRVTDIDDVILNSSGAVVAFFVWRWAESRGLVDRWLWRWLDPARGPSGGPEPAPAPTAPLPRSEQPD